MGYESHEQQGRIEYAISLDMTKEISMVERNEKGKQARQYFIECEKKAKQLAQSVVVVGSRKRSTSRKPTLTTVGRFCFDAMERMIALIPGLKPEIAAAHALEQIRVSTGEDVSELMRALPSVKPEEITALNATEIGKQIGAMPVR